jgi:GNAT superfamily N-acetyltransferase
MALLLTIVAHAHALQALVRPAPIHGDLRTSTIFSMKETVSINTSPWPERPGEGCRHVFFRAKVGDVQVGECGLEVIPMSSDGLTGDDLSMKHRPVLSGTLHVHPSYRRQGIAQHLLREAESQARWWGHGELILMVKSGNTNAMKLYEKLGYTKAPVTAHHGGEVCMRRNLFTPNMHTLHSMLPKHTAVVKN